MVNICMECLFPSCHFQSIFIIRSEVSLLETWHRWILFSKLKKKIPLCNICLWLGSLVHAYFNTFLKGNDLQLPFYCFIWLLYLFCPYSLCIPLCLVDICSDMLCSFIFCCVAAFSLWFPCKLHKNLLKLQLYILNW